MPWNKAVFCLEVLIYKRLQMWRHNDVIDCNEYLIFLHCQNPSFLGNIHCNFCLNLRIIHGDMKENVSGCFFWTQCRSPYTCGISFLLHSVDLILFTFLLIYFILHVPRHLNPFLRSHHDSSLPQPFISDLKSNCSTSHILHCLSFHYHGLPMYNTEFFTLLFSTFCTSTGWMHLYDSMRRADR